MKSCFFCTAICLCLKHLKWNFFKCRGCALSEKLNTFSKLVSSKITMQVWNIPWENFHAVLMFILQRVPKRTQFSAIIPLKGFAYSTIEFDYRGLKELNDLNVLILHFPCVNSQALYTN